MRNQITLSIVFLLFAIVAGADPFFLRVAEFGAAANDGQDDSGSIQQAIFRAKEVQQENSSREVVLLFDAGIYTLKDAGEREAMLLVEGMKGITLQGARHADGSPATTLTVVLPLGNDVNARRHLDIIRSEGVAVENLSMDHDPRFNTSGVIVETDRAARRLTVDILEGATHFDGMKCYSANSWDLAGKSLIPAEVLTQGVSIDRHLHQWRPVPGGEGRRYQLENCDFIDRVEAGQGLSWHFNAGVPPGTPVGNNVRVYESKDVAFRNVRIYSTIMSTLFAAYNENLSFEDFRIEPGYPSLAVGPRDGIHLSKNTGRLWVRNIYIKGVRWDPLVARLGFVPVAEVTGDRRIRVVAGSQLDAAGIAAGGHVTFFAGEEPFDREVAEVRPGRNSREFWIAFAEPLPDSVIAGTLITPSAWNFKEAVIRDSVFEGNHGTPIVYQSNNLLVENNVFRNNAYSNIGLGPTSQGAGGFARNIVIRGNQFLASTWLSKSGDGTISSDNKHKGFRLQPYNTKILIENNLFQDLTDGERVAAIHLRNAQQVIIRSNRYVNVKQRFKPEPRSTRDIVNLDTAN